MAQNLDANGFEVVIDPVTGIHILTEGYHSGWIEFYPDLGQPVSMPTFISYRTVDGTAKSNSDYQPISGRLSWNVGSSTSTSPVPALDIINDQTIEPDETFVIEYYSPIGDTSAVEYVLTISDTLRSPQTNSIESWQGVENLTLTGTANINGTGNNGSNAITGNAGNNSLIGKGGNDVLDGKGGNDVLTGFGNGKGEIDILIGGTGRDRFNLTGNSYIDGLNTGFLSLTSQQLKAVMPQAQQSKVDSFLQPLNQAMQEFDINNPLRQQAFLAQIAHESGSLRYNEEIWGPTPQQKKYEPPSSLATQLGNTQRGDGYRYRGRGLIQLTGGANYRSVGQALGLNLEGNPDLILQPRISARVTGYFWKSRGLNSLADAGNFEAITRRINGGLNGYPDRLSFYSRAKQFVGPFNDSDYAVIKDFNPSEDVIALSGVSSAYALYSLPSARGALPAGVALGRGNELIAVIQGNKQTLSLSSNYFQFS